LLAAEKDAVIGVVAPIVTLAAVIIATQNYPADDVTVSAKKISNLTMAGSASATLMASATSFMVTASSGQVDVVLPVPADACSVLHDRANAHCDAGVAQVTEPITTTWTAQRPFEVEGAAGSRIVLATQPSQAGEPVSFSVTGEQPVLRLCVGQIGRESQLTIRVGSTDVPLPAAASSAPCTGLVVSFRSVPSESTSAFILQGVTDARLDVFGRQLAVTADTLKLTPHSTRVDAPYDTGRLEVDSDREFAFSSMGGPAELAAQDQVVAHATNVTEAEVERLPNEYEHYTWFSYGLTVLGGVVTLGMWLLFVRRKRSRRPPPARRRVPRRPGPN
jgi:hypothetical protein